MNKVLDDFTEQMGCDWVVDDWIPDPEFIALYDHTRYLNYSVHLPDGRVHNKIIPMLENDEILITIKKKD